MNFDKTKTASIALILMLTFSATILAFPFASAHDPAWEIPTWAYMSVSPSPLGVNQEALIVMWLNDYPITAVGAYGDRWDNMYIDVTTPSGTKETLGPFTSDPVGSGWTQYTPTQIGTYTFVFRFDGDTLTGEPVPPGGFFYGSQFFIGDIYLPSQSDPVYLEVTEDQVENYPESSLPEGYWTRPISGINRDWWKISGNWLQANDNPGRYNRYSDGPGSSHIMWTRPYWAGGIMGGQFGAIGYYTGQSYETFGSNFIVLNGVVYYNVENPPRYGWYAVDLRTGEELFFHNTTGDAIYGGSFDFSGRLPDGQLTFGQIYNFESPNQHGGLPYLWAAGATGYGSTASSKWMLFDAFTGNWICNIENVSAAGTSVYGKDGSILRYNIAGGRLTCWNTSRAIWYEESFSSNEYWMWRPDLNVTFDGNNGFSLNVSLPDVSGSIRAVVEGDYLVGGTSGMNREGQALVKGNLWAVSLEAGKEGTLLWNYTFTPPFDVAPSSVGGIFGWGHVTGPNVDTENGGFYYSSVLERKHWFFDLATGQPIWETDAGPQWDFYGMSTAIADGKFFTFGYGGVIDAYNINTGEKLWSYTSGTLGFETAYENTPLSLGCIADGKMYMYSSEHSPTMPLARGRGLRCVDMETGQELWQIHHWAVDPVIADGYIVSMNLYDNQIYCYGKGPSETTVTAAPKITEWGRSVMIEGTVTDQCAGAKSLVEDGKFSMVPAIADGNMDEWMEYLYMQRPCPTSATGVEVKLETLDPNGNFYEIATVTSDASGMYKVMWEPPVPGEYTIIATFAGSEAYAASYAETSMGVEDAPTAAQSMEPEPVAHAPAEPTPTTPEPTEPATTEPTTPETTTPEPTTPEVTEPTAEAPFITTEVAIIAVVAVACVIGVVSFWALRKRK